MPGACQLGRRTRVGCAERGATERYGGELARASDVRRPTAMDSTTTDLAELDARLLHPPAVGRVDHVDERIGLVKVVAPVRPDRLLPANVPHVQLEVAVRQRLRGQSEARGRMIGCECGQLRMVSLTLDLTRRTQDRTSAPPRCALLHNAVRTPPRGGGFGLVWVGLGWIGLGWVGLVGLV